MKQGNAKGDWLMLERKLQITSEEQNVILDSTDIHFEEIADETSLQFTGDLHTANLIESSSDSKMLESVKDSNASLDTDINQVSRPWRNEAKDFVCSICGDGFTGEKQFYGHLRVHAGEVLWKCTQCSGCNNKFESQSKLKIHENLCHNVVRPFKCHLCGLVFDRTSQLDYHQRSVHLGEKSQVCQICGKGFFRRTDLRTHLNIHLGTNLCICEICGRKFNHMSNLIRHSRTHAGVKPYPCTVCGKRFTQISSLTRHKRIHGRAIDDDKKYSFKGQSKMEMKSEGRTINSFQFNNTETDGDRVIKRHHYCKICGESFQFMLLLRQHEQYHLENVETLECKNCGKKFQNVREIKEHSCQESVFHNLKVEETDNKKTSRHRRKAINSTNLNIQNNQTVLVQLANSTVNGVRSHGIPKSETTEEARTEGTIVCVTSEQLANINLNQVEDSANHFLHEHLMELTGKINTVSTGLDQDANINVSEILGTYSCETIELSNANSSYPRAYQIQSLVSNENNDLESKENVIYVQTLEKDGLAIMSEDGNIVRNITFDLLMEKDKKNLENSCLEMTQFQISGSTKSTVSAAQEPYILESGGEKINKEKNSAVTSDRENVDNVQSKMHYLTNVDNNQSSEIIFQNNKVAESSRNNKDLENINSDREEPTLRLVQTENGEQFYELIINNLPEKTTGSQSTKNSESSDKLEERLNLCDNSKDLSLINDDDSIEELNMKLVQTKNVEPFFELARNGSLALQSFVGPTQNKSENHSDIDSLQQNENKSEKFFYTDHKNEENPIDTFTKEMQNNHDSNLEFIRTDSHSNFENYEKTNFEVFEKTNFVNNTDQFFEFVRNAGDSKEVSVHKEQFFELIQDPLELDKARHLEFVRTNKVNENNPNKHSEIIDNLKGNKSDLLICVGNNLEFQTTTSIDPDFTRKKEDRSEDKSTIVNLYLDFTLDSENKISTSQTQKPKTSIKKFQCTVCNKSFSTSYNFKQHIGTHFTDQQKFQCKECGIPFAWKSTLNKHMATHHRADGPQKFVCEICPKVYSTLSQVNEHVKRDHLKERNHVCLHCGKSFFKKFDLKTHGRTHTKERPYVCRACGKGFHHQSHIIRHERIHSGERPYSCDICQRTFTQLSSLKVHKQRHREIQIDILDYRLDEDDPLALSTL